MDTPQVAFRCIAYQENDKSYTSVCLDLDIVEESHTTLQEAVLSLNDAISSHLHAAQKLNWPKELLNRPAPSEYWKKLDSFVNADNPKKVTTNPIQVYNYADLQAS